MSLINDALEKARSEADARAERERATGGPSADYRPPRAHLPRRAGWAPGLAIGLILGAVLVGALGLGWWLGRSSDAPEPAADTVVAASPTEPTIADAPIEATAADERPSDGTIDESTGDAPNPVGTLPPPAESAGSAESAAATPPEPIIESEPEPEPLARTDERTEARDPVSSSEPAEPLEPVGPALQAPDSVPTAPIESPEVAPTQTEPAAPRPTLIQPPEQVGHVADNVYVLEAQLGGLTLELDFIVWGATPFAQINGRQVEVDQAVDGGFLVDAIDRQQVTLKHADGRVVVLRIR